MYPPAQNESRLDYVTPRAPTQNMKSSLISPAYQHNARTSQHAFLRSCSTNWIQSRISL